MRKLKYTPKMKDRVRIAWTSPEYRELIGHTGTICGAVDDFATNVELDQEVWGQWVFHCYGDDFRLEPLDE